MIELNRKKINLPKCPPNIEAHNVQPEETSQERKMNDEC